MIDGEAAAQRALSVPSSRLIWLGHLGLVVVLCGLLGGANWNVVKAAVDVWIISPTYSHCFFIIPVSAYLIWGVRAQLQKLVPAAHWPDLLLGLPLVAAQITASIASITELQQLAVIASVQVLTLAVLGRAVYRQIAFPMLFLFFLVPMGEYLVWPMQRFTTWFISVGLDFLGILHHTEGTVIQLVGGTFRVAEACAGLRFLIATVAIGALFSYLNYRKWYKIIMFMSASAVVPVIANGFRALGIVLLAHYSNNTIAVGTDHLVYGWGFSVVILGLLMFTGVHFADPVEDVSAPATLPNGPSADRTVTTTIVAMVIIFSAPAYGYWNEHRQAYFNRAAIATPVLSTGWLETEFTNAWRPIYPGADAALRYGMKQGREDLRPVDVQVLYYAKTRYGHGLISSTNSMWDEEQWHLLAQSEKRVSLGTHDIAVHEDIITSHLRTEMIWWTYWENGVFTTSSVQVKLGSLRNGLSSPKGSALIVLSTPVEGEPEVAESHLYQAAAALKALPDRLNAAAGTAAAR